MGLQSGDLEKVPKYMKAEECYERIYSWHKKNGKRRLKEKYGRDNAYSRAYLELLEALPSPGTATEADMNFIFKEVIAGLMEWAYHEEDEYGIKMAAYAEYAKSKKNLSWDEFEKSRKESSLFERFDLDSWSKRYS